MENTSSPLKANLHSLKLTTEPMASTGSDSEKTCAICLGNMETGQGQAIFTAECSHSFHFGCISKNVKHGNRQCPMCRCNWKHIPAQFQDNVVGFGPRFDHLPNPEPRVFSDDEPLPTISANPTTSQGSSHPVTLKAIPEFPAIAAAESSPSFAVLVGVQAPPLIEDARNLERAPIDLVTVLDVSGSMSGSKISLLKNAVHFVIQNLGPHDRLSIVSFSTSATRIFPLRRMTEAGRADAVIAINSVSACGMTNIVEGLKKGVRVLEERREKNPVASIVLLSDGMDTENSRFGFSSNSSDHRQVVQYLNLLPPSIRRNNRDGQNEAQVQLITVHTLGFGSDHDSAAMHAISDASGGTFSFIESIDMVRDSFARCIGGLLSVMSQELQITVRSVLNGATILSIPSGRYQSEISDEGKQGLVKVGDLYAEEEKQFLIHLSLPAVSETAENTTLVEIVCSYKDVVSNETAEVSARVEIGRPQVVSPTDLIPSVDVDRQRNRLLVAEGIARAQEMAEAGNLEEAQALLENRRVTLTSSTSAQAGDGLCTWLEAELRGIRDRMGSRQVYESSGRAMLFSGRSAHSAQRATTMGDSHRFGCSSFQACTFGYTTPFMAKMVEKSQAFKSSDAEKLAPPGDSFGRFKFGSTQTSSVVQNNGNPFQNSLFGSTATHQDNGNLFQKYTFGSTQTSSVVQNNGNPFQNGLFGSTATRQDNGNLFQNFAFGSTQTGSFGQDNGNLFQNYTFGLTQTGSLGQDNGNDTSPMEWEKSQ